MLRVIRVGNIRKRSKEADMLRLLAKDRRRAGLFFALFLAGVGGLVWWVDDPHTSATFRINTSNICLAALAMRVPGPKMPATPLS